MRKIRITDSARADLTDIRRYSVERYGQPVADAYLAILQQAIRDLRDDPYRPGSKERPEIGDSIRSYHTALSSKRAASRVGAPRHFILYFLPRDDELVVSRILHDSRDLARHVPDAHRKEARRMSAGRGHERKGRTS